MRMLIATLLAGAVAMPAWATPKVVTDISPVQGLVARVMQGIAAPDVLLPRGASPHDFALRPSQAGALADADLLVWVGPAMTPWLERARTALATKAVVLTLIETPGTAVLGNRKGPIFDDDAEAGHDHAAHGDDDSHGDDHAKHDEHAKHDDSKDDHDHGHGHAHKPGAPDPHAWLDPQNAVVWTDAIAASLSAADPVNAALYAANAEAAKTEIAALSGEIEASLAPVAARPWMVYHDALHYFEHRFGFEAVATVTLSDDAQPSPRQVSELRSLINARDIRCLVTDTRTPEGLAATLSEGTNMRSVEADPLGFNTEPGPTQYTQIIRALGAALVACTTGP